jgi:hypothetical protein
MDSTDQVIHVTSLDDDDWEHLANFGEFVNPMSGSGDLDIHDFAAPFSDGRDEQSTF